jgi:16S rRNA (adenine1518-N6/adenine1519-N6)-dimethyltransferase
MATTLLTPPRVRALLDAHGLRPVKALGQHYLADPNTVRKVARLAAIEPGEQVLEVGPGLGSLTLALREAGARVVAVEADARLLPALAEALGAVGGHGPTAASTGSGDPGSRGASRWVGADPQVEVQVGDALRVDLEAVAPEARKLVANLPYNIAATLVLRVLGEFPRYQRLIVMVQREVGERLAAASGSDLYGAVSVKVAARAEARVLGSVSRRVFVPEPRVDSVLLELRRRRHPALDGLDDALVTRVIDAAFAQRRKTLRNALRGLGLDPAQVEAVGRDAGVDLGLRAERLDLPMFAALARALARVAPALDVGPV